MIFARSHQTRIMPARLLLLGMTAASLLAPAAWANGPQYSPFTFSVSSITTQEAYVGQDQLKRSAYQFGLSAKMPLSRQWSMGASIGYDSLGYRWQSLMRGAPLIANSVNSFNSINRYNLGLSLSYRMDEHWIFLLAPKVQFAAANTASTSEAMSYGVVTSAMYRFEDGNILGLGVAYLNDIDEVQTIPYIAVRWQLAENWQLANPFETGFSGPAGLEVSYQASSDWQFGVGSSRRTQRILLLDANKQTLQIDEWVGFVRAGWELSPKVNINAYLGYYFGGEMEVNVPAVKLDISNQAGGALAFEVKF
ncbi:autotransporter outer membrane beta-barrel domain-containing protein [Shewanella sp. SNU WT4]|nr:autotransporter outer membrane beta-barrel domain-containing protein [Shewanella sp. SNU WT4]